MAKPITKVFRHAVALQQHAPKASAATDAQRPLTRRPAQIADFKATLPRSRRASLLTSAASLALHALRSWCAAGARHAADDAGRCAGAGAHQIPKQDAAVVGAAAEEAALRVGPLQAVDGAGVAFELEERLAWLSDVEDANDGGVLGEGGEEVSIVRRGGDAEKRWWVGEC